MFGIGAFELLFILFLGIVLLGPKRIPVLAENLGKALREFNKAKNSFLNEINNDPKGDCSNDVPHEVPLVYQDRDKKNN